MQEETVWEGTTSHVAQLGTYLICLLTGILVIPLLIGIWKAIELKSKKYRVTTERIRITEGILSKSTEELELYRVKDIRLVKPFLYRMFSKGNIQLTTSDPSAPTLELHAVPEPEELLETIRTYVEKCRDRKRVREVDMDAL